MEKPIKTDFQIWNPSSRKLVSAQLQTQLVQT